MKKSMIKTHLLATVIALAGAAMLGIQPAAAKSVDTNNIPSTAVSEDAPQAVDNSAIDDANEVGDSQATDVESADVAQAPDFESPDIEDATSQLPETEMPDTGAAEAQ